MVPIKNSTEDNTIPPNSGKNEGNQEAIPNAAKDPATLPVTTFDNGIAMINSESCAALGYDIVAVKQAFDGKCSSVLETTTQQNFD